MSSETFFPCGGCGTPIYTIGSKMTSCPCQEHEDKSENEQSFRDLITNLDALSVKSTKEFWDGVTHKAVKSLV